MPDRRHHLAEELRDGLLQDLLAVALLIESARRGLRNGSPEAASLDLAAQRLVVDIEEVRSLIDRLQARDAA
ncbi:MAG: hypothetical protein AMXMBFR23_16600 [Chloroflexota bacterium]